MCHRLLLVLLLLAGCVEPMPPTVTPASLDFGVAEPDTFALASFAIANPGQEMVNLSVGLDDGGGTFEVAGERSFELAPGGGRLVGLRASSPEPGAHAGFAIVVWSDGEARIPLSLDVAWSALDGDRDGIPALDDCDDADPGVHPGAIETCDGRDEDCSGVADDAGDQDGDGSRLCADCDDGDPDRWPGAPELCNGIDDDCTGILPGPEADADGDGHMICLGDCNDGDATIFPGAEETCDGHDEDCSGEADDAVDQDGDGVILCEDCDDGDPTRHPGASELCNGLDEDCDGTLLDTELDADSDGFLACADDCDDSDAARAPGAIELCDGVDQDCDGSPAADEVDGDGDSSRVCAGDCDDTDLTVHPGAVEICDGLDQDCDGSALDEELDGDGDGYAPCAGDCDDADSGRLPGATELCDGLDQDCDGALPVEEQDSDGDGMPPCLGDCGEGDPSVLPGAPELCDGLDNDCDTVVPAVEIDGDGDGPSSCAGDCDDADPLVSPGAPELCDRIDGDCDGAVPAEEIDGDGDGVSPCEGDCEDTNPLVFPSSVELCDGLDNDCSLSLPIGELDGDGDGFVACSGWSGGPALQSGDCDPGEPSVYPGAAELCNGVDDDCAGGVPVDEIDGDLDGHVACGPWVGAPGMGGGDCDPAVSTTWPGAPELCNGLDDSCSGVLGVRELDGDGDGYVECGPWAGAPSLLGGDCDDGDLSVNPGELESCNGVDDDCSGSLPLDEGDLDLDLQMVCDGDCDDSAAEIWDGAPEICDTQDNDCDGPVDELWDQDGDGWIDEFGSGCLAAWGGGSVDCDDGDGDIHPQATELCDGLDQDCSGAPGSEEIDADGDGLATCEGDCDDGDPLVSPDLPEVSCNGIDDDCDGDIDPGDVYQEFFGKGSNSNLATIWQSNFDGSFDSPVTLDPPGLGTVYGVVPGDFDGDSDLDLIVERVPLWPTFIKPHLYSSDCQGSFVESSLEAGGMDLDGTAADLHTTADLDLDGDLDVIGWDWSDGEGLVWLNDGTGTAWTQVPSNSSNTARPFDLVYWESSNGSTREFVAEPPIHLAGSTHPDLLECGNTTSDATTNCRIHTGDGDGTFTLGPTFAVTRRCNGGAVADFDGDGWTDFVCGLDDDGDAGQAWIWYGASSTFAPTGNGVAAFDVTADSSSADQDDPGYGWISPWDWDGDGDIDLIASIIPVYSDSNLSRTIYHLSNDGFGQFSVATVGTSSHPYSSSYWTVMDDLGVPVFP